ncbi:MAG: hypothetical protein NTU83_04080 [Candidatus Hydrogenedentes bacterium]|nr:hypothetical protein [Candidatus Hydrogenedentota bacterium]
MIDDGYVDYFQILKIAPDAKPGEVRTAYKQLMKDLVMEIARIEITEERRDRYLLEMAKLNAAFYILRENETRETYWGARSELIALEDAWRTAVESRTTDMDSARRTYDGKLRHFLSKYVEEAVLEAGHDKACVDASNWDAAHERHASRILRHYRQGHYQRILERLPYWEVTPPQIDWDERKRTVAAILVEEAG